MPIDWDEPSELSKSPEAKSAKEVQKAVAQDEVLRRLGLLSAVQRAKDAEWGASLSEKEMQAYTVVAFQELLGKAQDAVAGLLWISTAAVAIIVYGAAAAFLDARVSLAVAAVAGIAYLFLQLRRDRSGGFF